MRWEGRLVMAPACAEVPDPIKNLIEKETKMLNSHQKNVPSGTCWVTPMTSEGPREAHTALTGERGQGTGQGRLSPLSRKLLPEQWGSPGAEVGLRPECTSRQTQQTPLRPRGWCFKPTGQIWRGAPPLGPLPGAAQQDCVQLCEGDSQLEPGPRPDAVPWRARQAVSPKFSPVGTWKQA